MINYIYKPIYILSRMNRAYLICNAILLFSYIVNGAPGDTLQYLNDGTFTRIGIRFNEGSLDDDFVVMSTLGEGKQLWEVSTDPDALNFTYITEVANEPPGFSWSCGKVHIAGQNAKLTSYLLDTQGKTITAATVFSSLVTLTGSSDSWSGHFNKDCTKFFVPQTSNTDPATDVGFHIFDIDPTTAVATYNSFHLCDPAICGDGSGGKTNSFSTIYGSFAASGDGNHVFMGISDRVTPTGSNVGGIVHFFYDGTSWTESWYNNQETAGGTYGMEVTARSQTLFVASDENVWVYNINSDGSLTQTANVQKPPSEATTTDFSTIVRAYSDTRFCTFTIRPAMVAASGTSIVWDLVNGVWNSTYIFHSNTKSNLYNSEDGYCGKNVMISSDSRYVVPNTNNAQGVIDLVELADPATAAAPSSSSPTASPTSTTISPTVVCDNAAVDCNPVSNVDFSYKNMEIVTYSTNAATVSGGSSYEYVIKYVSENPFELLNEIRVCEYQTSQTLDCSNVKMWLDGTVANSSVVTDGDGRQCCDFDTFGVFTRPNIQNTYDNLFFLMDGAVADGEKVVFERTNTPIVPDDIAILYAFHLHNTTLSVSGDNTVFTLEVHDVDHSNNPDFNHIGCDDKATTMASIDLNGCTLFLNSQPTSNTFEYLLPSTDYEQCATSVEEVGDFIFYNSTIDLPDAIGSCYYFQPGNDIQPVTIKVEHTTETIITLDATNLGVTVTDISTERCLPYEDYVLAHAKIIYTVRYKFNGTDVNLNGTPYLNVVSNPVTVESKTCTANECVFVLKTTQCERIYTADDGSGCVFDRNDVYLLHDLHVTEVGNPYSPVSYVHTIDPLDTTTETQSFPAADCYTPDYLEFEDVTDQYNYVLKSDNLPSPNWASPATLLDFFEEVVLQLSITDGPTFTGQDLQIHTVEFLVKNGVVNQDMTKLTFRLNDKLAHMGFSQNPFYKDAHFCRYFDNGSCEPFYDVSTSRTNPFVSSTIVSRLGEVCQTGIDDTKTDHFSLYFPYWVERIDTSTLNLQIKVTATLKVCSVISANPLRGNNFNSRVVKYITANGDMSLTTLNVNVTDIPTTSPTTSTTTSPTKQDSDELSSGAIAGISVGSVVAVLAFITLIIVRRRKNNNYTFPGTDY